MGDRGNWKWAVGETAAALTLVFGGAQWVFYGRLDIRPDDIGLGTDEVLVQAAVGTLALMVFAAWFWVIGVVGSLVVLANLKFLRWNSPIPAALQQAAMGGLLWITGFPLGALMSFLVRRHLNKSDVGRCCSWTPASCWYSSLRATRSPL